MSARQLEHNRPKQNTCFCLFFTITLQRTNLILSPGFPSFRMALNVAQASKWESLLFALSCYPLLTNPLAHLVRYQKCISNVHGILDLHWHYPLAGPHHPHHLRCLLNPFSLLLLLDFEFALSTQLLESFQNTNDHIAPLLEILQWLFTTHRIKSKFFMVGYKALIWPLSTSSSASSHIALLCILMPQLVRPKFYCLNTRPILASVALALAISSTWDVVHMVRHDGKSGLNVDVTWPSFVMLLSLYFLLTHSYAYLCSLSIILPCFFLTVFEVLIFLLLEMFCLYLLR